jgi:hypothetical protein
MPDHLMIPPEARRQIHTLPEGLRKTAREAIFSLLDDAHPIGSRPYEGVEDMYWLELEELTIYYNAYGTGTVIVQQVTIN